MTPASSEALPTVVSVGHSTRSIEELIDVLKAHGVGHLVDVRRFPGSRRHPHFAKDALAAALADAGVAYTHEPDLGGFREPVPGSPNTAWREKGFRGYADHLDDPEVSAAIDRVVALATAMESEGRRVAITCAELLPERCHRRVLSDALTARGLTVLHALDATRARRHEPPPFARIVGERVTYPDAQGHLLEP